MRARRVPAQVGHDILLLWVVVAGEGAISRGWRAAAGAAPPTLLAWAACSELLLRVYVCTGWQTTSGRGWFADGGLKYVSMHGHVPQTPREERTSSFPETPTAPFPPLALAPPRQSASSPLAPPGSQRTRVPHQPRRRSCPRCSSARIGDSPPSSAAAVPPASGCTPACMCAVRGRIESWWGQWPAVRSKQALNFLIPSLLLLTERTSLVRYVHQGSPAPHLPPLHPTSTQRTYQLPHVRGGGR